MFLLGMLSRSLEEKIMALSLTMSKNSTITKFLFSTISAFSWEWHQFLLLLIPGRIQSFIRHHRHDDGRYPTPISAAVEKITWAWSC
jgi:hypothetical protein